MLKSRVAGFTLLEVLVALAVLAVSLLAALRATAVATQTAEELRLRQLATWLAQDRLEEHRARRDWLPLGQQAGEAIQGGESFRWEEKIAGTPNARFRRIEVRVMQHDQTQKAAALAQMTGFLVRP